MCVITKLIQYQFLINHAFLLFQAHSQLFSGGGGGGGGGGGRGGGLMHRLK